jgi:hypothetical protein
LQSVRFCRQIVSDGQTGVARGALDLAIERGDRHGGWAPHGREAEDGKIPLKYQLIELDHGGYRQRTRRDVQDNDGTMVINLGELDGGGACNAIVHSALLNKPHLVVQLDDGITEVVAAQVSECVFTSIKSKH